jgi:nitrite reductase (NADH) large subunit
MERQLDARAAAMLKQAVEAKGIEVILNADTAEITGHGSVDGVALKDGRRIEASAVVVAIGIRANAELARSAGIAVNRGIVVDDAMETNVAGIHAIGECAEHRGLVYGLVEPAYEQARVLADGLAGRKAGYGGSVLATNLKVSGVNVFSAGDFFGSPGTEEMVLTDPGFGTYKKFVITDGRLVGVVLFGDTADGLWYLDLIRAGATIEPFRDDLAFGRSLVEQVHAKPAPIARLAA